MLWYILVSLRSVHILMLLLCVYTMRGEHIRFKHLTVQHGLSQNSVQAICQDRRGFLWFGTQYGLNCYDGYTMTVYRAIAGDSSSLPTNYVQTLYEDSGGTLWIGMSGGHVVRMNPYSRRCTTITIHSLQDARAALSQTAISPEDLKVLAFTEDQAGRIWAATEHVLVRINPITNAIEEHFSTTRGVLHRANIRAVLADAYGNIWVGTSAGLLCYTPNNRTWERLTNSTTLQSAAIFVLAPEISSAQYSSHTSSRALEALYSCTDRRTLRRIHTIWIGTAQGVYCLDCSSKRITRQIVPSHAPVQALCTTEDSTLWIGYADKGLERIDLRTGVSTALQHSLYQQDGISHNAVLSLLFDRNRILWVGTDGAGVCYFSQNEHQFEYIAQNSNGSGYVVMSVLGDSNGVIWFGTLAHGLGRFDPRTGRIQMYTTHPNNTHSLASNFIWSLAEDRSGALWVGTYGGGLCRFDPVSKRCTTYRHEETNPASLPHNTVYSILEASDGSLWIATGGGLALMDRRSGACRTYKASPQDTTALRTNAIRTLHETRNKTLWIGTWGGGVYRFDKSSKTFRGFRHNPHHAHSISSDEISCIYEDAHGRLWIGTSNGLNLFDSASQRFSVFTEQHGLPNSCIYSIIDDAQGYLWLATGKGIVRFHPNTGSITAFNEASYRAGLEFNQDACFKDRHGYIYFGSVAGILRFHPDSIRFNTHNSPVVFTALRKQNTAFHTDTIASEQRELHLSVDDSFITIEFAALSFVSPEYNRYFCKLDNFDREWIHLGTKREITYANLGAGEYVLRVCSTIHGTLPNAAQATLRIIVHPHWWQTLWAQIGGGVILVTCGIGMYKWRLRRVEARQRELERIIEERTAELLAGNQEITRQNEALRALNTEKNEFLGIAAHDLKSPLTSIILSASIVQQYQTRMTVQEIQEQMSHIQITARRMQETILNLLDINAIESGRFVLNPIPVNIVEVVNDIVEGYYLRAQDKSIQLHFHHDVDEIMMMCDRNALMQVLENLISNAIKYSPPGKNVYVSVTSSSGSQISSPSGREQEHCEHAPILQSERYARVEVRDEGPGLSSEDQAKLFQKFARLSPKPTAGEHSTGLGLSIVKKITEVMGGRVWCETELGKGATFIVELPVIEPSADIDNTR
ncbi:MAG: two-component regulator propeller domain-containing protein [Bacteroidota bacterium]|nr:two-component regulator propeller domain-containing protein [Bacteroidota bacterium]